LEIKIITNIFQTTIYGFGGIALNNDYAGTAFTLSGKMWDVIKSHHIKNKGMNIWVYDYQHKVFAGVELENEPGGDHPLLEKKKIVLEKYAYCKHTGSYSLLKQTGQNMITELTKRGFELTLPNIEIYGHWTSDENKLETELFMSLK
jgi:effector-binding domain-containing protein